ncbi:MAG: hypothetical protein P4L33_10400 [Capsulimonadaceae bacterium]|nr:hypothetical protein [Capsulimonadaceae bacterium]
MKATIEYADHLVSELEKASEDYAALEEAAERLRNALEAARQTREYLSEADSRAHLDRPFLWVRRVTNATAASMSAASALVTAQNVCPANAIAARLKIKEIEVRSRELNARILAEPRPVVPGAPIVSETHTPTAPPEPVRPANVSISPISRVDEEVSAPPAENPFSVDPVTSVQAADVRPAAPPMAASATPSQTIGLLPDDPDPSPSTSKQSPYVGVASGEQALRIVTDAPVAPVAPAPDAPALVLSDWDETTHGQKASGGEGAGNQYRTAGPRVTRQAWYRLAPPKPRTLAGFVVAVLFVVFVGALAYPHVMEYVNKARGDRLGARIVKMNQIIKQQQRTAADLDRQIAALSQDYLQAQDKARELKPYLTPQQQASSDLADVQLSIASLTANDDQIRRGMSNSRDSKHDESWNLNLAMLGADAKRLAELNIREGELQAKVDKLAAPPAVENGVAEANKRVGELDLEIRAKQVDRQVLQASIVSGQQYTAQLRVEREHAYHPGRF